MADVETYILEIPTAETFGDALTVGRACDQRDFFWYEDSYRDASASAHGTLQYR